MFQKEESPLWERKAAETCALSWHLWDIPASDAWGCGKGLIPYCFPAQKGQLDGNSLPSARISKVLYILVFIHFLHSVYKCVCFIWWPGKFYSRYLSSLQSRCQIESSPAAGIFLVWLESQAASCVFSLSWRGDCIPSTQRPAPTISLSPSPALQTLLERVSFHLNPLRFENGSKLTHSS